ncbi:MAG: hypothetical protein DRI90_25140 [Deltaproteobacteria bacterium]|nr:MAG: hypothetical protein DRI90_25140 [Deltaproteobacteria bacterium]
MDTPVMLPIVRSTMRRTSRDPGRTSTWLAGILGCAMLLIPSDVLAGCQSDDDCRAGRLCRDGDCVYPSCVKDVDCPEDQICERRACVPPRPTPAPSVPAPPVSAPQPSSTAPSAGPPASPTREPETPVPSATTSATVLPPPPPAPLGAAPLSWAPPVSGAPPLADVAPTTEHFSPALSVTGALVAVAGGLGVVIGLPLVITAKETLNACYQSDCQEVDVWDTTQRDVGLGLAIPGTALLIGGVVMVLVGNTKIQVGSGTETKPAPQSEGARYVPDLVLLPFAGSARWRF